MLKDNINELIMAAVKARDKVRVLVLQSIKNEMMRLQTARNVRPYDETMEAGLLNSLRKRYEDSISQFAEAGRKDLVEKEQAELDVLMEFLPKPVTEQEIRNTIGLLSIPHEKPFMGQLIKEVKHIHPSADGGMVARLVKEAIQ